MGEDQGGNRLLDETIGVDRLREMMGVPPGAYDRANNF